MRRSVQELFEEYQNNLYAAAFNVCKNAEDAKDVVQDTFIQYYSLKKEFAYYKTSMLQDHYKMLVYSNYINKNLIWTNKQNLKKIIRTKYKNALKDNPQYYMTLRQKILGKLIFTPEPIYKIVVSFIRFVKKVISWK